MKRTGYIAAVGFVLTVYLANLAVSHWGIIPVGFHLTAPAGVLFAGLAFSLRDVTGRALGRRAVLLAILAGAVLSYWVGANAQLGGAVSLAWASAIAFTISELADMSVYEPIRKRGWLPAVAASNIVGLFVDSILFLTLALGSLTYLWGQVVGKAWMTAAAIAAIAAANSRRKVVPV